MSQGFAWQLALHVPPNRVFAALVRTTTMQGRLYSVEEFGKALTFSPSRSRTDPVGRLRARVHAHTGGCLLELTPIDDLRPASRDTVVEAESVGNLIHDLRTQLGTERDLVPVP